MLERGENRKEREVIYWKYLRLLNPEYAAKFGLPGESPIFVSPTVDREQGCDTCRVKYKPLVYQAGVVVLAHHFHTDEESGGGIYYFAGQSDPHPTRNWIAILQPLEFRGGWHRSPKVLIKELRAYCLVLSHRLNEGLALISNSETNAYFVPVCDIHAKDLSGLISFRFQISDSGEVHFSKV